MESGRKQDRKAVGLLVKLAHANVDTFAEEYATNLSPGGMFIRSKTPQPIGTQLKFEVQIAGGVRVMRGTAVVRWIRGAGDPAGAPGMGVQFDVLDPATRALVDKMVAAASAGAAAAPAAARTVATKVTAAPKKAPEKVAPTPAPVDDSAAALEAELRAQYGDPSTARAKGAKPLSPPLSIAPVVATVAPVTPAVADEPLVPIEFESGASSGDEQEIPIEMEGASGPTPDSIDLSLDSLIAQTPEPAAESMPFDPVPTAPSPELQALFLEDEAPATVSDALDIEVDFGSDAPAAPAPVVQAPVIAKAPLRGPQPPPAKTDPPPLLAKPAAVAAPAPRDQVAIAGKPVFLTPPSQIDPTGPVIGIDLGTTNSCVGILQAGKPVVMRSKQGYNTLPSIVSLTAAGKVLVAHPAKNQMVLNPSRTIYGAKRLVGRGFDSPTVKQVRERFHYDVIPDTAGRAAVRLGDHLLTLEEVQGLILRECKEMAEREMGKPVSRAVVTVPAYYSEPQREAVRKAGAMAGLKVERILNEPTAAALAFGMNRELDRKILVYDLGGGTFDATVLKIEKNIFEVLATGGDTFLGGTDFDNTITDVLLRKFQQIEGVAPPSDPIALSRVTELAERAKCALSERASFDVHIPMLMMDPNGGKSHDLRCVLTRDELEEATMGLVDRTLDVVRDVLLDAKLQAKDVDDIILVGGQSRMPIVREKLKALFGKPAHASVNADEAVALGAALYSGSVDKVSSVVLIDVLPMTIGVAMTGGAFKRVLERNTPLPTQRSFSLPTSKDNETTIEFQVFQGEDANVAGNEYLGTVRIEGLPKAAKGLVKAAITLRLDAECVLHAEALELTTRKQVKATLATRYTPDEVQKKLGITAEQVTKATEKRAAELTGRAGGFWGFLKKIVRK